MNIWQILEALALLAKEIPGALAKVEAFVAAGDWTGLIAYLEGLLQPQPSADQEARIRNLVAQLKDRTK